VSIKADRSRLRSTGGLSIPSDTDSENEDKSPSPQDEEKQSSGFTFRLPKIGLPKFGNFSGSESKEEGESDTQPEVYVLSKKNIMWLSLCCLCLFRQPTICIIIILSLCMMIKTMNKLLFGE